MRTLIHIRTHIHTLHTRAYLEWRAALDEVFYIEYAREEEPEQLEKLLRGV
jgi:hypothetical protein